MMWKSGPAKEVLVELYSEIHVKRRIKKISQGHDLIIVTMNPSFIRAREPGLRRQARLINYHPYTTRPTFGLTATSVAQKGLLENLISSLRDFLETLEPIDRQPMASANASPISG